MLSSAAARAVLALAASRTAGADDLAAAAAAPHDVPQQGVELIGRWLPPAYSPTATYAGSEVVLRFKHSSTVTADLTVSDTKGDPLFVSVSVDGGVARRLGLTRGDHARVALAAGLSPGPHVVVVRKEGEPYFGALKVSNPRLDVAGRWQSVIDDRPVIEVIGDSDATGICALGPDSPKDGFSIWRSDWASQAVSWVGMLEQDLAAVGHPANLVDLAISGSTTRSESDSYDLTAPGRSDAQFGAYFEPGQPHASLVLLWGGGNDRHGGGDLARRHDGAPLTYADLSDFEKGVHDQLTKIFARNPGVKVVLLGYIDPTLPGWKQAYDEVEGLFPEDERRRMYFLRVYVPKGKQDACQVDPFGHPNVSLHATWAAQILTWMMSREIFGALGFPGGEDFGDL
jgi:hypothetical protein